MMPKINIYYLSIIVLRILLRAMSLSQFQFKISMRLHPTSICRFMYNPIPMINFKGSRQWQTRQTAIDNTFLEKESDRPPRIPIVVHIYVEREILQYLNMKNHLRKTRLSLPRYSNDGSLYTYSESSVRDIVERALPPLTNESYKLRYQLVDNETDKMKNQLKLKDVGSLSSSQLSSLLQVTKSLQLYVQVAPGVFPPSSETYYEGMRDPLCTETFTMVSFYKFHRILNTVEFAEKLERLWKPFFAVGRVYVASEGVNAQMAIPTNVIINFEKATQTLPIFESLRLNTDHLVSAEEFAATRPFKALHVRVREQIVTDGFADISSAITSESSEAPQLDWGKSGNEMSPLDWHEQLNDPNAIILDCRNSYESDVGVFDNAIPLNTTFFRESWTALDSILRDKPKNTKLMTYCTGGIRCVKINAYLEQRLGFRNVHRLQGGIIAYARELESQTNSPHGDDAEDVVTIVTPSLPASKDMRNIAESRFKGVNYVFDERIGSRITDHVLTSCQLCGVKCDSYNNCQNGPCNVRFIQCASCQDSYGSCCSKVCQSEHDSRRSIVSKENILCNKQMLNRRPVGQTHTGTEVKNSEEKRDDEAPPIASRAANRSAQTGKKEHAINSDSLLESLSQYSERYSFPEPELLERLRAETKELFDPLAYRMVSGVLQGRLLSMLVKLTNAKKVLELGSFTGYSALCFAEGMMANAASNGGNGQVLTCEIDDKAADIAQKFFTESAYPDRITLERLPAMSLLRRLRDEEAMFDIVFIDADKKKYLEYVKFIIGDEVEGERGRPILNRNGLIIIDNTLWKGLVLLQDADLKTEAAALMDAESYGNGRRMTAIAEHMHALNIYLSGNPSALEPVMLPFRDGLTIIRFKGTK